MNWGGFPLASLVTSVAVVALIQSAFQFPRAQVPRNSRWKFAFILATVGFAVGCVSADFAAGPLGNDVP